MVQTAYDRVEIRYIPDSDVPPDELAIESLVRQMLDARVAVSLIPIDRFEDPPAGKFEETLCLVRPDGLPGFPGPT
jgi:hypothetical protein